LLLFVDVAAIVRSVAEEKKKKNPSTFISRQGMLADRNPKVQKSL
jgi:hypothetical protein